MHYKRDKAGGMAQAVEHLLSNCEALSTNPRGFFGTTGF
jgi:hypothetical protein